MRIRNPLALLSVMALAACAEDPAAPRARGELVGDVAVSLMTPPSPEELAAAAPSFGGYFLEGDRPVVYLGDMDERGQVASVLEGYLASRGLSAADIKVRHADYRYKDLGGWFDAAGAAFEVPGVTMVDLDEARNRVMVGVDNPAAVGKVRAMLRAAGVPDGALIVEPREAIRPMATLRDRIRPLGGGIQINFPGYLCTLGFNATSNGQKSFITNSHCTTTQGGVESTPYWQPASNIDGTQVATEVADPAYLRSTCPSGIKGRKVCRYSDASRAAYRDTNEFFYGTIHATSGPNNGSLEAGFFLNITGTDNRTSFPTGTVLNKIGRTTGWTRGSVTNTCVHTGVSGTQIVQLCQTHVAAGVNSGDSGSPVFAGPASGTNSVTLAGILWGGGGSTFVFSPFSNIERELGTLTVFVSLGGPS